METSLTEKLRSSSIEEPPHMSDLNIMVLGSVGVGKSASGNTILGNCVFKEGFSTESVTKTCQSAQTEIDGKTITVIDTVGLCDPEVEKITDVQSEIEKMIESTDIDVFLLVIKLSETFTKERNYVVNRILGNFGEKVLQHTIVLFTHGDQLQQPIEDYLSKDEALRSVVDQCSGGVHVFNNRHRDRAQVTELLEKINTLREKNEFSRYTEEDYAEAQESFVTKKYKTGATVGGVAGGAAAVAVLGAMGGLASLGGAAGGSALSTVGMVALAATVGAALGAAAVGAGVYFMARN